MDEFFVAIPSVQGLDNWVVYQTSQLDRPLYVGQREVAEFVVKRRNSEALARYRDDAVTIRWDDFSIHNEELAFLASL